MSALTKIKKIEKNPYNTWILSLQTNILTNRTWGEAKTIFGQKQREEPQLSQVAHALFLGIHFQDSGYK